jgi:hypothetical protein
LHSGALKGFLTHTILPALLPVVPEVSSCPEIEMSYLNKLWRKNTYIIFLESHIDEMLPPGLQYFETKLEVFL